MIVDYLEVRINSFNITPLTYTQEEITSRNNPFLSNLVLRKLSLKMHCIILSIGTANCVSGLDNVYVFYCVIFKSGLDLT